MITTTDIANILYMTASRLEMDVFQEGAVDNTPVKKDTVVVHSRPLTKGRIWDEGFQEFNVLVPDTFDGKADLIRLNEIERIVKRFIKGYGRFDNTPYRYEVEQTRVLERKELKAHCLNAKVMFKAMNLMNN